MSKNQGGVWIKNFVGGGNQMPPLPRRPNAMGNRPQPNAQQGNNNVPPPNNNVPPPNNNVPPPQVNQRPPLNPQAQQRLDNAKLLLTTTTANPQAYQQVLDQRIQAALATPVQNLTLDLQQASTHHDDVTRSRLVGPHTKDKGFYTEVEQRVQTDLGAVMQDLADPTKIDAAMLQKLQTLNAHLTQQKEEFAKAGRFESDSHKKQRGEKTAAIVEHQIRIQDIAQQVQRVINLKQQATDQLERDTQDATQTVIQGVLDHANPQDRTTAAQLAGKMLAKLPQARRQALLAQPQDIGGLAATLENLPGTDTNDTMDDLIQVRGQDKPFMDLLSETMITNELASLNQNNKGATLRGNSNAVDVFTRYNKATASGQQYIQGASQAAKTRLLQLQGPQELDPVKMRADFPELANNNNPTLNDLAPNSRQIVDARMQQQKQLVIQMINDVTAQQVPDEIAKICATIYDGYVAKIPGQQGIDEANALIGGHIMLRLVTPQIVGDKTAAYLDPQATTEQKRAIVLQGKLLQNVSNSSFNPAKEQYLLPARDLLQTEVPKLNQYFQQIVQQGRQAKQPPNQQQGNAPQGNPQQGGNQPQNVPPQNVPPQNVPPQNAPPQNAPTRPKRVVPPPQTNAPRQPLNRNNEREVDVMADNLRDGNYKVAWDYMKVKRLDPGGAILKGLLALNTEKKNGGITPETVETVRQAIENVSEDEARDALLEHLQQLIAS